jgi:hypothetical protein
VLGYLMIKAGASMTDDTRSSILAAINDDGWNVPERIQVMKDFKLLVEKYDGTPINLESETLWDALFKFIDKGESGLINKL